MRSFLAAFGLLAVAFAVAAEGAPGAAKAASTVMEAPVAGRGYEIQEVQVGKATLKLPIPQGFVAAGRDEDWAKAYFDRFENLTADPRKGIRFLFARLTPAHFAQCREAHEFVAGPDCWATVQGSMADRDYDLVAFAKITDGLMAEFSRNGFDGVRKAVRREVKDETFNETLGSLGKPLVVGRDERSLQILMPSGPNFMLLAHVLVEGMPINLILQRPKAEARELMVMMDDWVAEILKTTPATRK